VVHEVGRALGLGRNDTDENASMSPMISIGETRKRDLAADDRNGVVFKYPAGEPNGYCDPAPDPNCSCAPPGKVTEAPPTTTSGGANDPGANSRASQDRCSALNESEASMTTRAAGIDRFGLNEGR
jgi:hypothetical protein